MAADIGVIEGFFGPPYSYTARGDLMEALRPHGYSFYLYAPKSDAFLRRRWREPHPAAETAALAGFAARCRAAGVRFGVGLSPFEAHFKFDDEAKAALAAKISDLNALGCEDLAVLFDDMRGDLADLAGQQAAIVDFAAARSTATRLLVCPSYYTDDPVLDRVFGQRPANYLSALGAAIDPSIALMWTGEEVCSREFSAGHLERVAEEMRRPPFLWDNYPVNDGPRMSQHLHLRAFTGRGSGLASRVSGHAVNPALQPTLSRIPLITLPRAYREGPAYAYGAAFWDAMLEVLGSDLADRVRRDLYTLEDGGLAALSGDRRAALIARYAAFDHPAAQEIVGFLSGVYTAGDEVMTQ